MVASVESTTKKNITMKKALFAREYLTVRKSDLLTTGLTSLFSLTRTLLVPPPPQVLGLLVAFGILSFLQGLAMYSMIKDTRLKGGAMTTKEGQAVTTSVNQLVVSPAALAFMPNEIAAKVSLLTYKGPDGTETLNKRVSSTAIVPGKSILYRTTEGDTLSWSVDETRKIKVTSFTGETWEHCVACDVCTMTNVFAEDEEVLAAVDAFEDAVKMTLHESGRALQTTTCESGCGTEAEFDVCELYHVKGGHHPVDSPHFDRESWLKRFKPCGWYKENCGDTYSDAETLSANVDYMGGRDWLSPSEDELIKDRTYVVEFDVGIHPHVLQRFNDMQDPSLLNAYVPNTVDLDSNYRTNRPVVGETCLEIPVVGMSF